MNDLEQQVQILENRVSELENKLNDLIYSLEWGDIRKKMSNEMLYKAYDTARTVKNS